jgi:UDP:flavonoid glycosyltransferase YjiC (YdhE family)
MARFLICTMPVTGHVNPGLPIARALVERGHAVAWYTGRRFRAAIEATGAQFAPIEAAVDPDDISPEARFPERAQLSGLAGFKFDLKHLFLDDVPGQVADLRRILRDFPADVLLADTGFVGAGALHELGGPPYAIYGITALTLGSRDTAPFGLALPPNASPLGRLRNRALAALFQHVIFRDVAAYANGVRRKLGLPPLQRSVLDGLSPFLYLQSSTSAFEYPRSDLPPQVHFIGPLLPAPPHDFAPPAWWDDLGGDRPVVLVNQGTVANDPGDLIVPALRALAGEGVLVIATTGGASADHIARECSSASDAEQQFAAETRVVLHAGLPSGLAPVYVVPMPTRPRSIENPRPDALPANARIEPFIPFGALLPHVDVMITNGGYGGVQFALAHGVPLIVAGATEEKPEIAARVAWSGAGINLKTKTPTSEQVRAAVHAVLTDLRYHQKARRIQDDYARHNAPEAAAVLLERLAATGQPVLREQAKAQRAPRPVELHDDMLGRFPRR